MTALVETLDLEEIRGEIIRSALNSEIFYAFPVSYLISLLKKITHLPPYSSRANPLASPSAAYDSDLRDLLKTIQIQLCLKQGELSPMTIKKLVIVH